MTATVSALCSFVSVYIACTVGTHYIIIIIIIIIIYHRFGYSIDRLFFLSFFIFRKKKWNQFWCLHRRITRKLTYLLISVSSADDEAEVLDTGSTNVGNT